MKKPKKKKQVEYENSMAEDLIEDTLEGRSTFWFWGDDEDHEL